MANKKAIHTLHRYYIWSDRMRAHFDHVLQLNVSRKIKNDIYEFESLLYMSYWYAGLFVVIEGWWALKLSDQNIDNLLRSRNVALLKRYRNGIYHFQKNYYHSKFMDLIAKGQNVAAWVRSLNSEFGRWFLTQFLNTK